MSGRRRFVLTLAGAILAVLASVNCTAAPEPDPPVEPVTMPSQDEWEDWMARDHPPPSIGLKRLGAGEGGVWVGESAGRRLILRLGKSLEAEDSYLAVLWGESDSNVQFFKVNELRVGENRKFAIQLGGVEGEANAHYCSAYGEHVDGRLRVDEFTLRIPDLLPKTITLDRADPGVVNEADRLRAEFIAVERDPYGR